MAVAALMTTSLVFDPGWLCLAVGLVVFVAVARPWWVARVGDAVVDHVREAERSYGRMLGVRAPPRTPWEQQRSALVEAVRAGAPDGRWPVRYAVRRFAWHVLDHGWEIEDKRVSPPAPSGGEAPR